MFVGFLRVHLGGRFGPETGRGQRRFDSIFLFNFALACVSAAHLGRRV